MNEEQIIEDNGFVDFMMEQEIKKQLIKLAKDKGFESLRINPNAIRQIDYYLWLCELQKWIYDNKKMFIELAHIKFKGFGYYIYEEEVSETVLAIDLKSKFKTPQLALESGLTEALKLT